MGRLEVICGPMFSGKSEELLRRLRRADIAKKKHKLFKPACDDRYSSTEVVSHSGDKRGCVTVDLDREEYIFKKIAYPPDLEIVAFDEVQFFSEYVIGVIDYLVDSGVRVIVAGLDMDSEGYPFGPMPSLMARAEEVLKLTAVCQTCGNPATHTHRKSKRGRQVLVGAADIYEARCREHWYKST